MTKVVTIGVALGFGLVVVASVVVFRGGVSRPAAVPAAIGLPDGAEYGAQGDERHVTHYPVVISPKDLNEAGGLGATSPARSPAWPERSPAARDAATVPDSFSPRSNIRPIPDSFDTGSDRQSVGELPGHRLNIYIRPPASR